MLSRFLPLVANVPLSVVGLLIFFSFFVLMFIWVTGARRKSFYQSISQLPLQDEGHSHESTK